MSKWKNGLETATNIAVLCVCILIAFIGVRKFLFTESSAPTIATPKKGDHLDLPGVDWSRSDRTLVMALSTQCHFCSESVGFYQRLVPLASASKVAIVAVFPQPTNEARDYWTENQLPSADVDLQQSNLAHIEVFGTPTLLVVNRKGLIVRAWTGKLPAQGEAEVIKAVQG